MPAVPYNDHALPLLFDEPLAQMQTWDNLRTVEDALEDTTSGRIQFGFHVLIGTFFCAGVPLMSIGPSFITWFSTIEVAWFLLFAMQLRRGLPGVVPTSVAAPALACALYTAIVSIGTALLASYPLEYSLWTTARFFQWLLLVPLLALRAGDTEIRALSWGVLIGALINSVVCIAQTQGISPVPFLMQAVNVESSGPWQVVFHHEIDPLDISVRGASGVYSYSRTSTGFLLGISSAFAVALFRPLWLRSAVLLLTLAGILATGSRLGLLPFFAIVIGSIILPRQRVLGIAALVVVTLAGTQLFPMIVDQFDIGDAALRTVGLGPESYLDGLEGRQSRQEVIWLLPFWRLVLGVGAGNLGFALGLHIEGFSLYGAHGFAFQYLACLGAVGSALFLRLVYLLGRDLHFTALTYGVIAAIAVCAVSDDLLFPSSQAGHFPIIVAIAIRLSCAVRDRSGQPPRPG